MTAVGNASSATTADRAGDSIGSASTASVLPVNCCLIAVTRYASVRIGLLPADLAR